MVETGERVQYKLLGVQTMIHWCRNVKCLDLQKELDKLAEVIKEVEKLVIPVE